VCDINLTGVE